MPTKLALYRIVGWARPTATRITSIGSICRAGPNFMQSVVSTFPCSFTLALGLLTKTEEAVEEVLVRRGKRVN